MKAKFTGTFTVGFKWKTRTYGGFDCDFPFARTSGAALSALPYHPVARVDMRAAPLLRVKAKITVKNAVCESLPRQHTEFLTVILTLALKSGVALRTNFDCDFSFHLSE